MLFAGAHKCGFNLPTYPDALCWDTQMWFQPAITDALISWTSESFMIPSESAILSLENHLNPTMAYRFHSEDDPMAFSWFF
jgi:hypothetical protein